MILDWSNPNTARTEAGPVSPFRMPPARQGGVNSGAPQPLTGSLADYDALAEAVDRYRSTWGRPAYEAMRDAATRCGMPQGEPPLSWSVRRVNTYRATIGA
jgi:hypothetical protein